MPASKLSSIRVLRRSVLLVCYAAPKELTYFTLLSLITGVGPSIALYLGKVAIDDVARLLGQGAITDPIARLLMEPRLLWTIAATILLNVIVSSLKSIEIMLVATLRDRVNGYATGKVLEKVAYFNDIALFETPDLLNLLTLTDKSLIHLQRLTFDVMELVIGVFVFVPSAMFTGSIAWWIPLLLVVTFAPAIHFEMRQRFISWHVEETQASLTRQMDIYSKMLREETYAKELRLFSLQSVLLRQWRRLFQQSFNEMQQVRRQGAIQVTLWSMLSGVGTAFSYLYVILGVLRQDYTFGDLALYTGIILEVRRGLLFIVANFASLQEAALATQPMFQLFDLQPQLISGGKPMQVLDRAPQTGIAIRNLSFTYPEADRHTLDQINLTIHPGEMVALVGENGAGKTTLSKLLCRLYDPTQGAIYWNGQNYQELDLEQLRSHIAVVMQDYARFPATLRENVGWGNLLQFDVDSTIAAALQDAGVAHLITKLDRGLETPLGKQLETGIDLSGGQWQRIAIARALIRLSQAELLIFDEPTAALDPKNEHEIYQIFRQIAQGRMSVVVSHRLALAKMADRIVVLEHGRIIESGTHTELMRQGDRYYEMFSRQASSYIEA